MMNLCNEKGNLSFDKCIFWLESKGKELFGKHFQIVETDHELIFKLLVYIFGDKPHADRLGISLQKGILLTGPVGCGKTSLMTLIRLLQPQENRFFVKSCRDVSFEFIREGYSVIQKYSKNSFYHDKPKMYCFDDLGTENSLKYFGNECNVMAEILLSRYDLFISWGMVTYITTNLNSSEIESLYGIRVRSRMRKMFNLISFDSVSIDKRF